MHFLNFTLICQNQFLMTHTQLELYSGKKNVPKTGPKYHFCMLIRPSNEPKKKKIERGIFEKNAMFRFLPYKAISRIKGKITK